jgi:hypothetical protein
MIPKDPHLKPLHERPYTPGEQFIIGPADPPGAPISGNPTPQPPGQAQEQEQLRDQHTRP